MGKRYTLEKIILWDWEEKKEIIINHPFVQVEEGECYKGNQEPHQAVLWYDQDKVILS